MTTTRQHYLIKTLKVKLINIHFIIESFSSAINKISGAGDYSINTTTKKKLLWIQTFLSGGNWSVDAQWCKQSFKLGEVMHIADNFNLIEVIKFDESFYSASNKWFVMGFFEK